MRALIRRAALAANPPRVLAAATPDAEVLRTVAHTLRGSSSGLGAASMAELCLRLETRASVLSAPEAVRLVAELETEFARVREEPHILGPEILTPALLAHVDFHPAGRTAAEAPGT